MRMKRLYLAEESMLKFHDTKLLSIILVQLSAEMSTKENEEQLSSSSGRAFQISRVITQKHTLSNRQCLYIIIGSNLANSEHFFLFS